MRRHAGSWPSMATRTSGDQRIGRQNRCCVRISPTRQAIYAAAAEKLSERSFSASAQTLNQHTARFRAAIGWITAHTEWFIDLRATAAQRVLGVPASNGHLPGAVTFASTPIPIISSCNGYWRKLVSSAVESSTSCRMVRRGLPTSVRRTGLWVGMALSVRRCRT